MSNRPLDEIQSLAKRLVVLAGKVPLSAAAAVGTIAGKGFSAAKTGTGTYRISFVKPDGTADAWYSNVSFTCSLEKAAAAAFRVEPVGPVLSSSRVIGYDVRTVNSSDAAADVSAASTINFTAVMGESSIS